MEQKKKQEIKKEKKVSKKKIEAVKLLAELINKSNTIIIASIKNLPSRQFQDIRKNLRDKAAIRVVKKRIMTRAIEESKNKTIEKLKEHVQEDSAILFSKEDAFALAGILAENKNLIKAKSGQEAVEDIEVEVGLTDLIPGPAITEFGNLGIKIAVEEGKIAIKEKKIIVKKGKEISEGAASIMSKLDIKPFKIGLEPLAIYDSKTGKIYTDIKIDKDKAVEDLKTTLVKALGFAQKIAYYCTQTIGFLLAKANSEGKALNKLQTKEKKAGGKSKNTDEKKEEVEKEPTKQKDINNKSEQDINNKTKLNNREEK